MDFSPVEYIHIPVYPCLAILLSYPLFYLMEMITNKKLKNQGYPCDKILYELKEFTERKSKRESERQSEKLNSAEGGEAEKFEVRSKNLNFSEDMTTAQASGKRP